MELGLSTNRKFYHIEQNIELVAILKGYHHVVKAMIN
jgi:hypothetical protein